MVAGNPEVSVVIPCLNEARTLGHCIEQARRGLDALSLPGEVVVADNGSSDGSPAIAQSHGARVVNVARKGYGAALQAGIAAASGRFIVMGDGDASYDFSRIAPFVVRLQQGDDLVMGNRFQGGIRPGAMPWSHRYIGNPLLTGLLNFFFHTPIGDAHCGLRAFRKDSFEKLKLAAPGMEFASEMVVKASLLGQKISEVPTVLHPDGRDRPPHLRSFRDGWRHLRLLLLLCPMWLYLVPAALFMGLGLGLMLWLTPGPRRVGSVTFDVHTMLMGAMAALVGYQILWMWAYAKIYGWTSGLLPARTFSLRVFDHLNLERGLLIGGVLLVGGLALVGRLFWQWHSVQLGDLDVTHTMRGALWAFLLVVFGVQTIFGSFLLSMFDLAKERDRG